MPSNEQQYYDALKRITNYMDAETLKHQAERKYGLPPEEALEMAYDNMLEEARFAIKRKRRPKL